MRITITNRSGALDSAAVLHANPCAWQIFFASAVAPAVLAISALSAKSSAAPFQFTSIKPLSAGGVELRSIGPTNAVHSLQISRDLIHWRTISFQYAQTGETMFQDQPAAEGAQRFYRLSADSANVSIALTNHHGWSNSIILSNGKVEAIVVPTVGRIMQFRFAGEERGPFWENSSLEGSLPSANSWNTAGSFGGDKVWPAPQSVWNWPPPSGFDSMVFTGTVASAQVTLTGPVDPAFGIRVIRQIQLHPVEPLLRITSTFAKVEGTTRKVGIWVITQLEDPVLLFLPVPVPSIFAKGYQVLGAAPKMIGLTNGLISLPRDRSFVAKIGNDAGTLLWVGDSSALLLESPRVPGLPRSAYPDDGSSAEIYTNPDPAPYIELELLGPLSSLTKGKSISATSLYRLYRRTEATPFDEAAKILDQE